MSLLDRIRANPVFRANIERHNKYCNGEGQIIEISPFHPFPSREIDCKHCAILERSRERKAQAKKKAKEQADGKSKEHQRTPELP